MEWKMASEIGYEPKTTFWQDFTIAEHFDEDAIEDTAKRVFEEWKYDIESLTEFIMVLNHKSWYWNNINQNYCELYVELYYKYNELAINYIEKHMPKEDLDYYFRTLD